MLVYFITDEPTKLPAVRAMLEPQYDVVPRLLGGDGSQQTSARGVLMVDVDLRQMIRVEQVRLTLHEMSSSPESCLSSIIRSPRWWRKPTRSGRQR